jgi:hypothetical protein
MSKHTGESRKKISEGLKRAFREGRRKNLTPMAGHKHSDATRAKMSASAIERIIANPNSIPDNTGRIKSNAGYVAVHNWVNKYFEPKVRCEQCASEKFLDWANKDGEYTRNREDWMVLCRSCHMFYDRKNNIWKPARLK